MATTYTLKRKLFAFGINNLTQAFSGMSNAARNTANLAKTGAVNAAKAAGQTGTAVTQAGKNAFNAAKKVDLSTADRLKAGAKGTAGLLGGAALVTGGAGLALGASDG